MANENSERVMGLARREISRLADKANKRLDRLARSGLEDTPAYRSWQENGAIRFGVKGKSTFELQQEFWRITNFLNARTSLVNEVRRYYKEISANIGFTGDFTSLKAQVPRFFKLTDAVEKRLQAMGKAAQALDYNAIWRATNQAIQRDKNLLADLDDIDSKIDKVLEEFERDFPEAVRQDVQNNLANAFKGDWEIPIDIKF